MDNKDTRKEIQEKFKALMEQTEKDPELKKEVFNSISTLDNIASIIDLFTVKFIASEAKFISDILPDKEKESPEE